MVTHSLIIRRQYAEIVNQRIWRSILATYINFYTMFTLRITNSSLISSNRYIKQLFMRYTFSVLFTLLVTAVAFSQDYLNVDFYKITDGYVIFADNHELSPVSVQVDLDLKNMKSTEGNNKIFVIPAQVTNYEITRVKIIDSRKASKFHVNTLAGLGDHTQKEYDYDYPYDLPYDSNVTHKVVQGYNGQLSHKHQHALDFNIPSGGRILAARNGVVVDVEDRNSKSCGHPKCNKYNNYVRIYHSDGTFAEYTHIKRGSAKIRKGDTVAQGQHIASSGNVGWATGAHLHFEVFLMNMDKKVTVPTKFRIAQGMPPQELIEKKSYKKNY